MICAISRVVVVLPLVPVTAMIGTRDGTPGGKSMSTTCSATLRGDPLRWRKVHPESRCCVHLDDPSSVLVQRRGDVGGDNVDARNIEPDDLRDPLEEEEVVGMHLIGTVDRGAPR